MPPSFIAFKARWRICDGSEHDVWRLNLAMAALIRSRLEEGDFVSIVGVFSNRLPLGDGVMRDVRGLGDFRAGFQRFGRILLNLFVTTSRFFT